FFFSSRRRHTSFSRDWSSVVCSSDLTSFSGDATPRCPSAPTSGYRLLRKKGIDECTPIEHLEIVDLLSHSYIFYRNLELVGNANHNAPFGCSVEFGENQSGHFDAARKLFGLPDRVLTRGCIEHEKDLVGRIFDLLAHHALDLRQLVHEPAARV